MKRTSTLLAMGCSLALALVGGPAVSPTETAEARNGGFKGGVARPMPAPKKPVFKPKAAGAKKGGLKGVKPAKPDFKKAAGGKASGGKSGGKSGGFKSSGSKSGGKKGGLAGVKPVKPVFGKAAGNGGKGTFQKPAKPGPSPKRIKPIFNPAANPPTKPHRTDPPPHHNGPPFPGPIFKPPGI